MIFEWMSDPSAWIGLLTLIVLEIVLGIDNLVFIAILAEKLPPEQRGQRSVSNDDCGDYRCRYHAVGFQGLDGFCESSSYCGHPLSRLPDDDRFLAGG